MKVIIIFGNTVSRKGLEADWEFSCLVDVQTGQKILFDTGASGRILLSNMKKIGIPPKSVSDIFISYCHSDHIGGLHGFGASDLLKDLKLVCPICCL